MEQSTKGIVLHAIKYGETSTIVHIYTQDYGLRGLMVKGVRSSKRNKSFTMGMFQPLTQLEIVMTTTKRGGLALLKSAKIIYPYTTIPTSMTKSSLCMFLAETLRAVLQEEEENQVLYTFLSHALLWLDAHQQTANFHLILLIRLTKYLGFYPDTTNQDGIYFDLQNGQFCTSAQHIDCISEVETSLLKRYLGMNFDEGVQILATAQQRRALINVLIRYYQTHVQGFKTPKSLAVLYEIFNQ